MEAVMAAAPKEARKHGMCTTYYRSDRQLYLVVFLTTGKWFRADVPCRVRGLPLRLPSGGGSVRTAGKAAERPPRVPASRASDMACL